MTLQEVLIKAAELLESSPTAWTQGHTARDHTAWPVRANSHIACSWCALGAIAKVQELSHILQRFDSSATLLASHLGISSIADWNDNPLRTREEVIEGLRSAAKLQTVAP